MKKTVKMFKMNLDTGEAEFVPTKKFLNMHPILKLDLLKDWIYDLKITYNKQLDNFEKEMDEII